MDPDHIAELFAPFGRVSVRRMFGGLGIYAEGTMFALAYDGRVYLRADDTTRPAFQLVAPSPMAPKASGW